MVLVMCSVSRDGTRGCGWADVVVTRRRCSKLAACHGRNATARRPASLSSQRLSADGPSGVLVLEYRVLTCMVLGHVDSPSPYACSGVLLLPKVWR